MTNAAKHLDELDALLAGATDKWSVTALNQLLRFGRKNEGPWDDVPSSEGDLPQDGVDAALIAALKNDAPALIACARAVLAMAVPVPGHLDGCLHKDNARLCCQCGQAERARNAMNDAENKFRAALNLLGAK